MRAKTLHVTLPLLVIFSLSLVLCVSGCTRTVRPQVLNRDDIPDGVESWIVGGTSSDYRKIDDPRFYVFEEEDDGYFVLAMLMSTRPEAGYQSLYFGLIKETTDSEGNIVWTGTLNGGNPTTSSGSKNIMADFHSHKFSVSPGLKYTAGWVKDARVAKIEVTCFTGETVTARIKNGFWWAGPYDWGNNWSRSKTVAYDKSGKVLYEVEFKKY